MCDRTVADVLLAEKSILDSMRIMCRCDLVDNVTCVVCDVAYLREVMRLYRVTLKHNFIRFQLVVGSSKYTFVSVKNNAD